MTARTQIGLLLVFVLAMLAAAIGTEAGGARTRGHQVRLQLGDYFVVYGPSGSTHVVCWVDPSFRARGTIECYQSTTMGLKPNTYSGAVGPDGTSVWFYPRAGSGRKVFSRPAGAQEHSATKPRFGHRYVLRVGDFASVVGTPVTCYNDPYVRPLGSIECYVYSHNRSGVKTGTLTVSVNVAGVEVLRYDAANQSQEVFARETPIGSGAGAVKPTVIPDGGWAHLQGTSYRWNDAPTDSRAVAEYLNPPIVQGPTRKSPSSVDGPLLTISPDGDARIEVAGTKLDCDATRDFKSHKPVFLCEPRRATGAKAWQVQIGGYGVSGMQLNTSTPNGPPSFRYDDD